MGMHDNLKSETEAFGEGYGKGRVIALKDGHYWRLKCKVRTVDWCKNNRKKKETYMNATARLVSIDSATDNKIKEAFRKENIGCNISFKSKKMYDLTTSQTKRMKIDEESDEKGIVYKATCNKCKEKGTQIDYIGETSRTMKVRKDEHCRLSKNRTKLTEIGKHSINEHGDLKKDDWDFKIIDREKNIMKRKIKEAYHIRNEKTKLNVQDGFKCVGMSSLKVKSEITWRG
jgi:hypothetical protein